MSEHSIRTPLSRVRGLGSAKDGTGHWWAQRLTAVAMVPLVIWLAVSLAALAGAEWQRVADWLASPLVALPMILFLIAGFWHLKLGLQVVIEDYIHTEWLKIALLLANTFVVVILAGAAILSVLKLLIGG
ncbi:MAG TPA: succinate dehydrogenase, hydrophobic membrane anchor protein [Alphaproteobacteria bacterium]|nr:succinate dehydrogenase, hydrophobic membrane anchor protein [Alphaproteobacteria bacterium]